VGSDKGVVHIFGGIEAKTLRERVSWGVMVANGTLMGKGRSWLVYGGDLFLEETCPTRD
jgi:hypothetical protein